MALLTVLRRALRGFTFAAYLLTIACARAPAPAPITTTVTAPAVETTVTAPPAETGSPAKDAPASPSAVTTIEPCAPAPVVAPEVLLASWHAMVRRRVTLEGVAVEQAIDFSESVVIVHGVRFAVWMAPGQQWTGSRRRTFTVLGSTTMPLHGATALPELLLEAGGSCSK